MKPWLLVAFICGSIFESVSLAALPPEPIMSEGKATTSAIEKLKEKIREYSNKKTAANSQALIFDLPVTYNRQVSHWINYFQTKGQHWFREWLERSSKYMPFIQKELQRSHLPADLAYMVMIESGFSPTAISQAGAVGPWQFIEPTGSRYGLNKNWWLDERRDFRKSTQAATRYIKDLYDEFGSWYLVAASYNMGEGGLRKQIEKAGSKDYWVLVKKSMIPVETQEYVPKILAAMLVAKAPNLYGFRDLEKREALDYDLVMVPGGTDLESLSEYLGVTKKSLKELNSELLLGYVPRQIDRHLIRVPKGAGRMALEYVEKNQKKPDLMTL